MARNTSAEVTPRTWDSALETRSGYLASDIRSDRRLVKRYFVRLAGAGRFELPTTCAGSVWRRGTECREQDSPPRTSERSDPEKGERAQRLLRRAHTLREQGKDPKVERECQVRAHEQAPTVTDLVRQRIQLTPR
jgi:hypothetical protein